MRDQEFGFGAPPMYEMDEAQSNLGEMAPPGPPQMQTPAAPSSSTPNPGTSDASELLTPEEANYHDSSRVCATCNYYGDYSCSIVSGQIDPEGSCDHHSDNEQVGEGAETDELAEGMGAEDPGAGMAGGEGGLA